MYSGQARGSKTHPKYDRSSQRTMNVKLLYCALHGPLPFRACTQRTNLSMAEVILQVTVKIERRVGAVGYDVNVCQEMLARYSAPLFIATGRFGVSLEQTGELERY